jgi:putative aldouronate transport system permease protein
MEVFMQTYYSLSKPIKLRIVKKVISCWQLYIFLLIPLIWLVVFKYVPMVGVQLAFRKFNLTDGFWNSPFVGLDNFRRFIMSYQFSRIIRNTITLSLYNIVANFPIPIILALSLNALRSMHLKKLVQMVTYAPYFISTTVMVGLLLVVLNPRTGLYGAINYMIFGEYPMDLFSSAQAFPHLYVWSGVWQYAGWNSIIYIAALAGVDQELHEAAKIDGATRFQRIIHIDFPCILPIASILLILNAGSIMSVGFEKIFLMQNNLNLRTSEVIATYVYKIGLTGMTDYSLSTAIDLFNSVINMGILLIVNYVTKRLSDTSLF